MNECNSCLGSGLSFMFGSHTPYEEWECSRCEGTGQEPTPPSHITDVKHLLEEPISINWEPSGYYDLGLKMIEAKNNSV